MNAAEAMRRRIPTELPVLLGILAALGPGTALAAERACRTASIVSDKTLRDRWPDLVSRVQEEVLNRDNIDACASITLLATDSTIRVEVTLPDGRAASRGSLPPEDVIPTLQALLLMPERVPSPTTPTPSPATDSRHEPARPQPRAPTPFASEEAGASGSSQASRARTLGVELSVVGGARFGDGQASYGLGAQSLLDLKGWLLGFEGRADRYYQLSQAQYQTALELGVVAGKRLFLGGMTLDLAAGPGFAIKGALSSHSDTAVVEVSSSGALPLVPQRSAPPEPSSGAVPRLLVGAHLGFKPGSVLRSFVGVDGTFGPARAEGLGANSPSLPRWTLGLTLGATVGTR